MSFKKTKNIVLLRLVLNAEQTNVVIFNLLTFFVNWHQVS